MRPDLKSYKVTGGGLSIMQMELTEDSKQNLRKAADAFASKHRLTFVYADSGSPPTQIEADYARLYAIVSLAIEQSYFNAKLPHKAGYFDWSLGPGVAPLAEAFRANYALFITYRGYRSTIGRQIVSTATTVVGSFTGFPMILGPLNSSGLACLVDLRSGDIVWANRLRVQLSNLDDQQDARHIVDNLLKGFPKVKG